jgi:hypothetical protein
VLNRREVAAGRVAYPQISFETLRNSLRTFQRGAARDVRLHVIGFEMKSSDAAGMRELARAYRGQVREF